MQALAFKEEQKEKLSKQITTTYLNDFNERMNQMKHELKRPNDFLPREKFLDETKYAMIICNQYYNEDFTGMESLPHVADDFKNSKNLAMMMGILPENIKALEDASYQ